MSVAVEAAESLRALAPDGPVETRWRRLARALGFGERRVKALYYREARRIDAAEMDTIRAALAHRGEATRSKARRHGQFFKDQAARLQAVDPEFYREEIDRLRNLARRESG